MLRQRVYNSDIDNEQGNAAMTNYREMNADLNAKGFDFTSFMADSALTTEALANATGYSYEDVCRWLDFCDGAIDADGNRIDDEDEAEYEDQPLDDCEYKWNLRRDEAAF